MNYIFVRVSDAAFGDDLVTKKSIEGCYGTVLLDNRYRQIAANCPRLPQIAYIKIQIVEPTNYDFLCPAWKIAISSLTTSALAAFARYLYKPTVLPFFPFSFPFSSFVSF